MKKSEIMQIIREEVEVILTDAEAQEFFDLDMSKLLDEMMPSEFDKGDAYGDTKESCAAKGLSWDEAAGKCGPWKPGLEEEMRTAKGNVTQATRKKHATVGKDKFPIFDKKSAESAIDLRGHAPEADRAKIINKAAEYAPEAAKKAREADKKKD